MALAVSALFFLLPLILAVFFLGITNAAMRDRSRLLLHHSDQDAHIANIERDPVATTLYQQKQKSDWIRFVIQYSLLLALLVLLTWIWHQVQPLIFQISTDDIQRWPNGTKVGTLNDPETAAVFILAGLLPCALLFKRFLDQSLLYPFLLFHVFLAAACCVADLLNINSGLNIEILSSSVLANMVWFVMTSHAVWALTYPNPLKASPYVLVAVIFSIASSISVFVLINFLSAFYGPTLATFLIYVAFGYGVFGSHLWSVSQISRVVG